MKNSKSLKVGFSFSIKESYYWLLRTETTILLIYRLKFISFLFLLHYMSERVFLRPCQTVQFVEFSEFDKLQRVTRLSRSQSLLVDWNPEISLASYRSLKLNRPRYREYHFVETIDNDFNRRLLTLRHLEMFRHTQENVRNIKLPFVFLNFSFVCQNTSQTQ